MAQCAMQMRASVVGCECYVSRNVVVSQQQQQQHNGLASVSQGWRSAAAFQLRIAPGRLEFQRSQHAVSGMYVGYWYKLIVCGIVGGRISSSSWLGLVEEGASLLCFTLLFFPLHQFCSIGKCGGWTSCE